MAPKNPDCVADPGFSEARASNGEVLDLEDELTQIIGPSTNGNSNLSNTKRPLEIVWRNVFWFSVLHIIALYGLWLLPSCHYSTWAWTFFCYFINALGITAGAHRLWTHRSYKAKLPLRILLAVFNSMAFQNDIIEWSRDHRVHHKYSETDADPHNAKRGFFFSHCGWLMCRKHPEVKAKGRAIDLSDLYADPVCMFQRKFYLQSVVLFCFIIPTMVPYLFWGEGLINAYVCAVMRYVLALNITWCVNSAAHLFGNKPYDQRINPSQNLFVTIGAIGEGFHNYHHVFPSDYSTSELYWTLNPTTLFIDMMALLGQVSFRKKMDPQSIAKRVLKYGDGTTGFGYNKLIIDDIAKNDNEKIE